jgi:hypothetical protein
MDCWGFGQSALIPQSRDCCAEGRTLLRARLPKNLEQLGAQLTGSREADAAPLAYPVTAGTP